MAIKTTTQTEYQKAPSFNVFHDECYTPKIRDDPPSTIRTVEAINEAQSAELAVWAKCDECRGTIHEPAKS